MNLTICGELSHFWQWDTERKLIVEDGGICNQVHFGEDDENALVCAIKEEGDIRVVDVPNILLQRPDPIMAYLYKYAEDGSRTRHSFRFVVRKRPKPDNYVYTQTEILNYASIAARMDALENEGVSDEKIAAAVNKYLEENPVEGGVKFETDSTLKLDNGILSVVTTNTAIKDDNRPITSGAVYEEFSKAVALLRTI